METPSDKGRTLYILIDLENVQPKVLPNAGRFRVFVFTEMRGLKK